MAHKVLVYSAKGGVGKTTTAAQFGRVLAADGHKTLLVDLDPDNTLSAHLIGGESINPAATLREALSGSIRPEAAIVHVQSALDLIPALYSLKRVEKDQADNPDQFLILLDMIAALDNLYDYVIMDAPGASNLLTTAAVVATDTLVIPTRPEAFDCLAIEDVLDDVRRCARQRNGRPLEKISILPTFVESRNPIHEGYLKTLTDKYPQYIAAARIHKARSVSYQNMGREISSADRASVEYRDALQEVLWGCICL